MIRLRERDLAWHEVDGSIICLDLATSRYLNVNSSGVVLWGLLVGGSTHPELVQCLVDSFDISPETALRDVDKFLDNLRLRNLLE